MLAYLDSDVSIKDSIDTGDGEYKFYSEIMKDHKPGGYGKNYYKGIFEKSSNIELLKLIDEQFGLDPDKYLNYMKSLG